MAVDIRSLIIEMHKRVKWGGHDGNHYVIARNI
jgi:hypothetical protein